MSFVRSIRTPSTLRQLAAARPVYTARTQLRLAHGDYGSGTGDPKAEKPQEQGTSEPTRDIEHPGPPAPDTSKHSGSGKGQAGEASKDSSEGDKKTSKGTQQQQGGTISSQLEQDQSVSAQKAEEIEKHNREMDNRNEKQTEQ